MPRNTIRTYRGQKKLEKKRDEPFSMPGVGQTFNRQSVSDKSGYKTSHNTKKRAKRQTMPKVSPPRFRPIRADTVASAKGRATAAAASESRPTLPEQANETARASVSKIRGLGRHFPGKQYRL